MDASVLTTRHLPAPLLFPYRAALYPFLAARRFAASLRPEHPWRTWITPRLLLGGFLVPGDAIQLARDGVAAVVDVSHELWAPRRALAAAKIAYHRVPCWDLGAPSLDDADRGVDFIAEAIRAGGRVHVQCGSGASRSVIVALCYLALHEGRDVDHALTDIRRKRPSVAMRGEQRAFVDRYLAWRCGPSA
jgi:protein-tyrosine phosphatase